MKAITCTPLNCAIAMPPEPLIKLSVSTGISMLCRLICAGMPAWVLGR